MEEEEGHRRRSYNSGYSREGVALMEYSSVPNSKCLRGPRTKQLKAWN